MQKIDLNTHIPDECNSIEIQVTTAPRRQQLGIYRSAFDPEPILMWDGVTTIIGRPQDKCLYVETGSVVTAFEVRVCRWFR
ncbi:MAG: hypothetical protein WD942_08995 [Dehalococcoidia bacterium]